MKKKELLAAAVDRRTDAGMETAWCQMIKKKYTYHPDQYEYRYGRYLAADVIQAGEKNILQISMWEKERDGSGLIDVPKYYIFLDRESGDYKTWHILEEKWLTAKIENLRGHWYSVADDAVYESGQTTRIIAEYLNDRKDTGYCAVCRFQNRTAEKRKEEGCRAEIKRIDDVMDRVPPEPEGFREWAEETGLLESRYIYYHYSRRVREGYCTHCRKMVPIKSPRHNGSGLCPVCRSYITYKADGKAATVVDRGRCLLLQGIGNGEYVLREYSLYKRYDREKYHKPDVHIREEYRLILDARMNPENLYVWDMFPRIRRMRWCTYGYGWSDSNMGCGRLFPDNLTEELKGSDLKYIPFRELFQKTSAEIKNAKIMFYRAWKTPGVAEYLIKCGLYRLALDYLQSDRLELSGFLDVNARGILQCLKCTKEQLHVLQTYDGGTDMLRLINHANKEQVRLTEEQIIHMEKYRVDWHFIEYMKYTTPHKMLRYVGRCREERLKGGQSFARGDEREYLDYLNMRRQCGYDLTDSIILYPRNLTEAHDRMAQETNSREAELRLMEVTEKFHMIQEMYENLNEKYAYTYGRYCIRPARSAEEIVREGRELHHCVGGDKYLGAHNRGESIILMLRRNEEPEKPWYTVEYNMERKEIVQWYAAHDKKPFQETVKKWLERWQKELKKRQQAQEKAHTAERQRVAI